MFNFKKASFKYTFMTKVPKKCLNLAQICPHSRPGFQVSAAPRHRSYCRPRGPTVAPRSSHHPLDGAAKDTIAGNLATRV